MGAVGILPTSTNTWIGGLEELDFTLNKIGMEPLGYGYFVSHMKSHNFHSQKRNVAFAVALVCLGPTCFFHIPIPQYVNECSLSLNRRLFFGKPFTHVKGLQSQYDKDHLLLNALLLACYHGF